MLAFVPSSGHPHQPAHHEPEWDSRQHELPVTSSDISQFQPQLQHPIARPPLHTSMSAPARTASKEREREREHFVEREADKAPRHGASNLVLGSSQPQSHPPVPQPHIPRRTTPVQQPSQPTAPVSNGEPSSQHSSSHAAVTSNHTPIHTRSSSQSSNVDTPPRLHFDISTYPSTDLLKLLAALLQQIASANDSLRTSTPSTPSHSRPVSPGTHSTRQRASRNPAIPYPLPPIWESLTSASRLALTTPTSPLTFHARNIPTISIESYLLRILKYCPTTNEVFLSLLVYFDRMSKMAGEIREGGTFAIDSYNVHRLVIAGITVASKFFSDVFYTNSRYAKVGGLPQAELNQLELQFLLLNDFRLVIPLEELQRYADQLLLYSVSQTPARTLPPAITTRDLGRSTTPSATMNRTPTLTIAQPTASFSHQPRQSSSTEDEGAETTDAEGDGTTDDEPTIRAAHSSASSEDTQSINTMSTNPSEAPTPASTSPRSRASSGTWGYRDRQLSEDDGETDGFVGGDEAGSDDDDAEDERQEVPASHPTPPRRPQP